MNVQEIQRCDLTELDKLCYFGNKLSIKSFDFWQKRDRNEISYFMYIHGIYVLPTLELIEWLKENIVGNAIEIGAGHGAIARELKIPITDSKMQEDEAVKTLYKIMGNQIPIYYNDDVEKLNAQEAIDKYNPQTVIGCYITHKWQEGMINGNYWGVEEEKLIQRVKRYINIGNLDTHAEKPILKLSHKEFYFNWLITRSANQKKNRIFVFDSN